MIEKSVDLGNMKQSLLRILTALVILTSISWIRDFWSQEILLNIYKSFGQESKNFQSKLQS